jgi:hypothetical protein
MRLHYLHHQEIWQPEEKHVHDWNHSPEVRSPPTSLCLIDPDTFEKQTSKMLTQSSISCYTITCRELAMHNQQMMNRPFSRFVKLVVSVFIRNDLHCQIRNSWNGKVE